MSRDEEILVDVASVWRQARVSCPHPDILRAYLAGGLDEGAKQFIDFHLHESECPFCGATIEDLRTEAREAAAAGLDDLRDRLLRSTVAALREHRAR